MTKGKKGQNRQTVISTTAQWPKERKDKMTNSDQHYSTMAKGIFCPFFPFVIVLYC
jgi:hypothetical protein